MAKLVFIIALLSLIINDCAGGVDSLLKRTKRFIVYPMGGLFKIVFGLAIPVKLGLKQTMTMTANMQFQYQAPQNISQLQQFPPIVSRSREKRAAAASPPTSDRSLAYRGVEALLDRYGINGHSCILRSICENALDSVYHKANGLYGHLFHIFLTPDYGDDEYDEDLDSCYIDAQRAGKYGVDCFTLYTDCPYGHGILDRLTLLE